MATAGIPAPGEAWAAPRLLTQLALQPGDSVEVGARSLVISRVLTFEPGQVGDVFGVSPRLLINIADVPATGVVQPGSRLTWQILFAGNEQQLQRYRDWLQPRLGPSHRLVGVHEGRRAVGSALERAERFLGLAVMAAIALAGVAIAMAARRYSERHFDMSAMLRCLGASQRDLLQLYLVQLAVLGLLASSIGCLLGWLAQQGLLYLLAGLLPIAPSGTGFWPVLAGLATGLVVLAGFALPPVMRLRGVPPLRVLRRDLTPLPSNAWLVYGAAVAAIVLLMWRYTDNAKLTLAALARCCRGRRGARPARIFAADAGAAAAYAGRRRLALRSEQPVAAPRDQCQPDPGLRPGPDGDGGHRAGAHRPAQHLGKPAAGGRAQPFCHQHPAGPGRVQCASFSASGRWRPRNSTPWCAAA